MSASPVPPASYALLLLGLLGACEAGDSPGPPDPQQQLRGLLAAADVRAIEPPVPEPSAVVRLGQALFFDKILSGNRDIGCSTCHNPVYHTTDKLMLGIGTGGHRPGGSRELGTGGFTVRHTTDLFGVGLPGWRTLMWDGRVEQVAGGFSTPLGDSLPAALAGVLAAQALVPLVARVEMRGHGTDELGSLSDSASGAVLAGILARLRAIPGYDTLFAAAFPGVAAESITMAYAANAIAAFEADRWSAVGSPFDDYLRGDTTALEPAALRGALLFFGRARCAECHRGPLLTDQQFHNTGVPVLGPGLGPGKPDIGRGAITGAPADRFRFRTPPLRNVLLTAPYTHNGSFLSLEEVVRHYRNPRRSLQTFDGARLDPRIAPTVDLSPATVTAVLETLDSRLDPGPDLSEADVADLVAFLRSLTDPKSAILLDDVPGSVPSGLPVFDE